LILAACYPSEQRLDPNCASKLSSLILNKQFGRSHQAGLENGAKARRQGLKLGDKD
jgi:hypothetical protein